ncbi:CaiB/BaiF CoA transferase family protein [Natrinema halophilum]|uniref:CaiB/BaiF CoA transferase family protein n=1 Tax=Natrinema halophilum TaxID=1699371 RepID=UPI001F2AB1E6|nr:CoA transferase [Natrinema halophilum]UHQ96216.1 CoA transferase [Natrinema halophilum]
MVEQTNVPQPLDGIRVLDLGQIYMGPYCGKLLGHLGADVIKIEPPGGENVRYRSDEDESIEVQLLNPSKRGIELDLKQECGKDVLRDLVAESDVLIENFATGKLNDLGVGYDNLSSINPELIYAHGSGFGDEGPYSDHPAMDLTIQAMGGVLHTTGFEDSPPVKAGPAVSDFTGAINLAVGIVSALFQREQTGKGQYVEVGMFDTLYPLLASPVSAWARQNDTPPRTGNRHPGLALAPYNVYEAGDGYVAVICVTNKHWRDLLRVIDREELISDGRFDNKVKRAENVDQIDAIIEEWIDDRSKQNVVDDLIEKDIPAAPVLSIEEITEDPHLNHRDMLNYIPNKGSGRQELPVAGMPIKFSKNNDPTIESSPGLGEHSHEVLSQVIDYSDENIQKLRDENVI